MDAPLIVFDYFSNALVVLGWIINNAIWSVMNSTGIAAVPFIAMIASEWYRARQEGDDEGNKGVLSINRIETRLYAMALVFLFTCQPILQVNLNTVDVDANRSEECGTRQFAQGEWSGATLTGIEGNVPRIPVWWALVHAISHGTTATAIAAIPCSTDFQSIRTEVDLQAIENPALQTEVGEFQRQCFGRARNRLFQQGGSIEATRAMDVDWIGSRYFQMTPGYYDSFHAGRPVEGFPYNAERDQSRPGTGPGQPGYPTCQEWWSADDVGLRARLHQEVDPGFWDGFRSVFSSSDSEDYVIRRMVSPRSGAAAGNLDQAVVGYRDLGGQTVEGALLSAVSAGGGLLATLPFLAGMDMLKQALPMVQSALVMTLIICLPFVIVISGYSYKAVGLGTFGLFAVWFLTFWWELARWLDSKLVDLIYSSDAAKMSWLSAANSLYDRMVLQFVEGAMYLILPSVWIAALGWAGLKAGGAISNAMGDGGSGAQGAGRKGGDVAQKSASGGKV